MTVARPYDLSAREHDYAPWDGPPRQSILICTHPRSGSTLLGEALYFAGGLGCPLEYFHAGFRPRFEERWGTTTQTQLRDAIWRHRTDANGVLSIKLMWRDIQELATEADPERFAPLADMAPERVGADVYRAAVDLLDGLLPGGVALHLYRRDRVRQAVSACIAEATGQWRSIPGAEMPRRRDPEYDAAAIERQIAYAEFCHRHWRNLLAAMPAPAMTLTYEALTSDYQSCVGGLLRQLGATAAPPPVRMRRQSDGLSESFLRRFLMEKGQPVLA